MPRLEIANTETSKAVLLDLSPVILFRDQKKSPMKKNMKASRIPKLVQTKTDGMRNSNIAMRWARGEWKRSEEWTKTKTVIKVIPMDKILIATKSFNPMKDKILAGK